MTRNRLFIIGIVGLMLIGAIGFGVSQAYAQGGGGFGKGGQRGNGDRDPMGNQNGYGNDNAPLMQHQFGECLFNTAAVPFDGELPAEVIEAMTAGLMDEYNAYASYQLMIDEFGAVRPFTSIQTAEGRHIEAWQTIFTRYGVPIPDAPVLTDAPTYATRTEACQAALDLEIANIALYDKWLATVEDYPDIARVVTALRNASLNSHIPALERCAQ